jgi:hypothetical protein
VPANKSGSKKPRVSRGLLIEGGIVVVAVAIILVVLIPKLTAGGSSAHKTYRQEVAISLQQTKQVAATFTAAREACTTPSCITNAASDAVTSMGNVLQDFNVNNLPLRAQNAGSNYSKALVTLQRWYLSVGFLNTMKAIRESLPTFAGTIQNGETTGKALENAL